MGQRKSIANSKKARKHWDLEADIKYENHHVEWVFSKIMTV